jgi:hypothetical protein
MQNETEKNDKNFAEDHIYSGNKKEPYMRAWFNISIGLIFVVAGALRFFAIQKWETKGGTIDMDDVTQWVYKLGGKWAIFGLILVVGLFFIRRGYIRIKRLKVMERM